MASTYVPETLDGENYPCESCQHTDCGADRVIMNTLCPKCAEPIGRRHFYQDDVNGWIHAACLEMSLSSQ